jgi:DNA-binding beta-propeller fold protein YncE
VVSGATIQKFAESGELLLEWGAPGSGDGEIGGIVAEQGALTPFDVALAAAPGGDVYVSDTLNHRVQRFSAEGEFLGKWGTPGSGDGELMTPTGIAVAPRTGEVYVVDTENHRVQRFDATGGFLGAFGSEGSGDGQFELVLRIAIDPSSGEVLVPDDEPGRVQRFSPDGTFVSSFDPGLGTTSGIDVDVGGRIFLSDFGAHRISVFSRAGDFLGRFGALGSGPGALDGPRDVAVGRTGLIAVADSGNASVQLYRTAESILGELGIVEVTAPGVVDLEERWDLDDHLQQRVPDDAMNVTLFMMLLSRDAGMPPTAQPATAATST